MGRYQDVFCRVEKKFLLSEAQAEGLAGALRERGMRQDEYGRHTISNIYYDTPTYELIRRSLEKPVYKEKLRLRAYGTVAADGEAFVEIKKKFRGVVYKRRVELPLDRAVACLRQGSLPADTGQIGREIDYFLGFWRPQPKALVAYDRDAYFTHERADLRVTFDHGIRYRLTDLDLSHGAGGRLILPADRCLMELKLSQAMPLWLPPLLERFGALCTSFSKYGTVYRDFIVPELGWRYSA